MGKKLIIPGADFSRDAIIFNGVKVNTVDGTPTTMQFYHVSDNTNPGVIITIQSGELTKFPQNTSGIDGYLDALFYQKPIRDAEIFYDGSYSLKNAFRDCSQMDSVKIKGIIGNASYMFYNCSRLKILNLDEADFSSCTSTSQMFFQCARLLSIDLSEKTFGALTSADSMFNGCTNVLDISLPNGMFDNCTQLQYMFFDSSSLGIINFGVQDFAKVTKNTDWLTSCPVNRITGSLSNIGKLTSTFGIGGTSRYDSVSMDIFINGLYDNSGAGTAKKFYMSQYNSDNLTTAQRNAIAAKNWEIMIAVS